MKLKSERLSLKTNFTKLIPVIKGPGQPYAILLSQPDTESRGVLE